MQPVSQSENILGEYIALMLDSEIYSNSAIMKTCYEFTDEYFFHITSDIKNIYCVYIYLKNEETQNLISFAKEFLSNLHINNLRQIVINETKNVRDEIIKKAFSPITSIIRNDYQADSKKIFTTSV